MMTYFDLLIRDLKYTSFVLGQIRSIKKQLDSLKLSPEASPVNVAEKRIICGCGAVYDLRNKVNCQVCGNVILFERRARTVSLYESYDSIVPYGFSSESYCIFESAKPAILIIGIETITKGAGVWIDTSSAEDYNDKIDRRNKLVSDLERYKDELKSDSSCKRVYELIDALYKHRVTGGVGKWVQLAGLGLFMRFVYRDGWELQYDCDREEGEEIAKRLAEVFEDDAKLQGFSDVKVVVSKVQRKEYEPVVEVSL